ncbi:MAG: DUF3108 domain-containing protein [Bdellovibrionales bacterium]|nr:DUF3108 domain-containing protein [Bdellovibrionales bacterium]
MYLNKIKRKILRYREGRRNIQTFIVLLFLLLVLNQCASRVLEYDKVDQLLTNEIYDKKIHVKELPLPPKETPSVTLTPSTSSEKEVKPLEKDLTPIKDKKSLHKKQNKKSMTKEVKLSNKTLQKGKLVMPEPRQPTLEDSEGFSGRRPVVDPFRVGEKVTLALSYFKVTAGTMDLEVLPLVEVNGVKSYKFKISARSNALFSKFYSVDDFAETFVDYEKMRPFNFTMTVKESKQLADVRSLFDWQKLTCSYWEKRVRKGGDEENKSKVWSVKDFSQNVISAAFYLRTFTLKPGKKLSFYVADDGKNILFEGDVLRKEKLSTEIGVLNTVVVRPQFQVDGIFKPVGEILMWLTDDDRKFIVRIESKIKIGTVVGKLKSIDRGL